MTGALLKIDGLGVSFGDRAVLSNVSLELERGGTLGLLGESGSGKSLTAMAALGLLPRHAGVRGAVRFDGTDMLSANRDALRRLRGSRIGMVFQEPMTALNPMHTARDQVAEAIVVHGVASWRAARERAAEQLSRVGLTAALADRYPHQLSGGERQRALIAAATVLEPDLLIADEPTTALDVVRQREVLDLLKSLTAGGDTALLFITHDIAVLAEMAERILVLRDGAVVDRFATVDLRSVERAEHTRALLRNAQFPERDARSRASSGPVVLSARDVRRSYRCGWLRRRSIDVLRGVDLSVGSGEIVGLVGPSGCGKSTLARHVLALERPDGGTVAVNGVDVATATPDAIRRLRASVQIVFQDPNGSFDPRRTVGRSVGEPLGLIGIDDAAERERRVAAALERVGIPRDAAGRYPHAFSGGQRQRLAIARATIIEPRLIVADEPVSALDVTVRGEVLKLFTELRDGLGVSILFISHDLDVVRSVSDRVAVMEAGRIVEIGEPDAIFARPGHEMTRRLIAARPDLDRAIGARQNAASASTATDRTMQARV